MNDTANENPFETKHLNFGAWYDISCSAERHCLCQYFPSSDGEAQQHMIVDAFRDKEIAFEDKVAEESYAQCVESSRHCWWHESLIFQRVALFGGALVAPVMAYTLTTTILIYF